MTLKMRVKVGKEMMDIEISDAGELSFPGQEEQLEYEIAYTAMGGTKTAALMWLSVWPAAPAEIICADLLDTGNSYLDRYRMVLLGADWVEHVLRIYEEHNKGDSRPRYAVEAAVRYIDGLIDEDGLYEAHDAASMAYDEAVGISELHAASAACSAPRAAKSLLWGSDPSIYVFDGASSAIVAAGLWAVRDMDENDPDEDRVKMDARTAEASWQARHFVHVMKNLRDGKPWPKIEETP
jgi:hypothetical protein